MNTTTPGYKTTEFWLSLLAVLIPFLGTIFLPTSTIGHVVALVAGTLAALGYTASRTTVKTLASAGGNP